MNVESHNNHSDPKVSPNASAANLSHERKRVALTRAKVFGALRRHKFMILPLLITIAFVIMGIFAPYIAPHSPIETNLSNRLMPPFWQAGGSMDFLLGTDNLGRDILSRLIHGARISIIMAACGIFLGGLVGTTLGVLAGLFGRLADSVVMRLTDLSLAIHAYLLAIVLAVVLGPSLTNVVVILAFLLWGYYARQARGEVLKLKTLPFIDMARVVGCSNLRIVVVHILPNIMNSLVVLATLQLGWAIVVEATLSFLGAGIPPPTPSWGAMISDGRSYISSAWWIAAMPGLAILFVVLSMNLLGDALRDALDPKRRQL